MSEKHKNLLFVDDLKRMSTVIASRHAMPGMSQTEHKGLLKEVVQSVEQKIRQNGSKR